MATSKSNVNTFIILTLAFAAIVLICVSISGCDSPARYDPIIEQQKEKQKTDDAVRVRYAAEIQQLEEAKNLLAIELAKARAEAKDTAALEARLAQVEADTKLKQAADEKVKGEQAVREFVIAELEKQKAAAGDVLLQVGQGAQTVGSFIPAPWGELVGTIGLVLAGLSETNRRKNKNAAIEAIGTMSTAIKAGHIVMNDDAARLLAKSQSPAAKEIVKQAQAEYSDAMTLAVPAKAPA